MRARRSAALRTISFAPQTINRRKGAGKPHAEIQSVRSCVVHAHLAPVLSVVGRWGAGMRQYNGLSVSNELQAPILRRLSSSSSLSTRNVLRVRFAPSPTTVAAVTLTAWVGRQRRGHMAKIEFRARSSNH